MNVKSGFEDSKCVDVCKAIIIKVGATHFSFSKLITKLLSVDT